MVQLLPVNETGNDHSPYNAISSVALEPVTIEITPTALLDLSAEEIAEGFGVLGFEGGDDVGLKVDRIGLRETGHVDGHVRDPLAMTDDNLRRPVSARNDPTACRH